MPNQQFSTEDQNEIRNASDRVAVVALNVNLGIKSRVSHLIPKFTDIMWLILRDAQRVCCKKAIGCESAAQAISVLSLA
jgi:hypothetical protein